ncbi:hypothetical protein Nmel_014485 [Mimus melanotis]
MIPVGPFQLWIFYDSVISTQASILFMDTERSTHSLPATAPGHAASAPEGWKTEIHVLISGIQILFPDTRAHTLRNQTTTTTLSPRQRGQRD